MYLAYKKHLTTRDSWILQLYMCDCMGVVYKRI